MDKLLDLLKQELDQSRKAYSDEKLLLKGVNCNPLFLSQSNFNNIPDFESAHNLCFVDGGNNAIISSTDLNLSFLRVAACIFKNKKRTKIIRHNYLSLITLKKEYDPSNSIESKKLFYNVKIFDYSALNLKDSDKSNYLGSINDLYLVDNINFDYDIFSKAVLDLKSNSIESVVDVIRRSLELKLLNECVVNHLDSYDMAIIDGSLYTPFEFEKRQMSDLFQSVEQKNVLLCALSKTTNLLTDNGRSIHSVMANMVKQNPYPLTKWYYSKAVDLCDSNYQAELFFAKFHKRSKHLFKFEIYRKQKMVDVPKVLGIISSYSTDPVFLGYPYGLISVDDLARVGNKETEILKIKFKHLMSDLDSKDLENSSHAVLDSIKF